MLTLKNDLGHALCVICRRRTRPKRHLLTSRETNNHHGQLAHLQNITIASPQRLLNNTPSHPLSFHNTVSVGTATHAASHRFLMSADRSLCAAAHPGTWASHKPCLSRSPTPNKQTETHP
ncbi:hypothetical protein BDW22DRAFT_1354969 [Trametopsis cervina]|nr:hypothetical protein BDW22DRAFT_1354969 [Trametopsis cervina]